MFIKLARPRGGYECGFWLHNVFVGFVGRLRVGGGLRKSVQYDVVGVIAVFIGVASWVSMYQGGVFEIAGVSVAFGSPFIVGFTVLFGLLCFGFGYLEGRKP